ncbi:MAG: hypothetical protein ACI8PZ_004904 [Myxococcota bacterium]|jgi:uncharacterized protein YbjT (DUF2867 family)
MKVVVAGATGFVGQHLVRRLIAGGRTVLCGTRSPDRARAAAPDRNWVHLDVDDASSLAAAFVGADALVYLVHQMRADPSHDLLDHERESAERVRQAAESAGIRRIVYLGGPRPQGEPSHHLAARLATGEALRDSSRLTTVELRAGMVIGEGSESWLICRDLAHRLPIMVLPQWLRTRSQPIGIDDAVAALDRCLDLELTASVALDLPGPEVVSAREILERIAAHVGIRPVMVPVPFLTPRLSSLWLRLVTRADYGLAVQLVDGLTQDLIASGDGFWELAPDLERTPLDVAITRALAAEPRLPAGQRVWEGLVRRVGARALLSPS